MSISLWIYATTSANNCFWTFSNEIIIFCSFYRFSAIFSQTFCTMCFFLMPFTILSKRTGNHCAFYLSISSSCRHNGAIFYQHSYPFKFISNIFFPLPCMSVELRRKIHSLWNETKPWDKGLYIYDVRTEGG